MTAKIAQASVEEETAARPTVDASPAAPSPTPVAGAPERAATTPHASAAATARELMTAAAAADASAVAQQPSSSAVKEPDAGGADRKRARSRSRWAAALLLAAAAYVCWVIARQVLWGVQEKEPWTALSVLALAYLVVVAWTMVLVAVTLWASHAGSRILWPWALIVTIPGILYIYHYSDVNDRWGGSLGADSYAMVALLAALGLLVVVALVKLAPLLGRLLRLRSRRPTADRKA